MAFTRRTFLKLAGAGLVGAVVVERSYDYFSQSTVKGKVAIIGGGAAGITMAAYLSDRLRHPDITLIEPSPTHRYQPGYTLIAAGLTEPASVERTTESLIPSGVKWVRDSVAAIEPEKNRIHATKNGVIGYDFVVVAPGCEMDFELIPGLSRAALGSGNAHSIYDFEGAQKCRDAMQKLPQGKGGNLIFTDTYTKMKCGGAPKKVTLLTEHLLRQKGRRGDFTLTYFNNDKVLMKPKVFGDRLAAIYDERKIGLKHLHRLVGVDLAAKKATFVIVPEHTAGPLPADHAYPRVEVAYDFFHFVPPMGAPKFVRESSLTTDDERPKGGWVSVDKFTLVHPRYKNVISLGDVAGTPASKTGAAIRMQAPVAAANLISLMEGREPGLKYNGYSACPIITEYGKVLMCEFGYDEKLLPTIPGLDPAVERGMWWTLKVHGLMPMYYHGMLKGLV